MTPTQAQIDECKAKNAGKVLHLLEYADGAVIAVQPSSGDWNRLVTVSIAEPSRRSKAMEDFARACIVWPSRADVDALNEERPAMLLRFGDALSDIAGASEKINAKKL